jgi:hypothetical protein
MGSKRCWRRVRVERGIYLLPNGKYAVCCRRAGRLWYRTVGSDLTLARSEREALIAAAETGVAPASPHVRFETHRARKPRNVGFHDYRDLLHIPNTLSGYSNPAGRTFIRLIKERFGGHAHILFSEQGVEVETESGLTRLANDKATAKHRQLLAAEDFPKLGRLPNVDVLDYYLYRGPTTTHEFDSALLDGKKAPPADLRPAYCYLVLNHRGCRAGDFTDGHVADLTTATASAVLATVEPNGLPTTYKIEWGTTPAYGHATEPRETTQTEGAESETVSLGGLRPCTIYHYQAVAENEANEDEASYGGDQTFTTECVAGSPPTVTLVPSTVPEGATFAGHPDTVVEVSANGLETYVEEFDSLEAAGPALYPAAWETSLSPEADLQQVGVVEPECVDPFFGGPLIVSKKFVASNAAGSADSGWIETHSEYCYPE